VRLIAAQEYLPFVYLLAKSCLVLTDSGGIQEEAPSLRKPVLILRSVTERPEAIDAGVARLVGTNAKVIVREVQALLGDAASYLAMTTLRNPFGDGNASVRIERALLRWLS
jgi:UDP-N-acetylglucosamine 2-epimerase (non-hydrolysing)